MDLKAILRKVNKPARYIGQEEGAIYKDWRHLQLTCCLCFPDKYEIGMSSAGIELLYFLGNQLEKVVVERCFAPDLDLGAKLKANKLELFALESQNSLKKFDLLCFSMQYELSYTNLLYMLDLAEIPLKRAERQESDPLVLIGGHCAYNPEPLGDFVDLAVIGEGELVFQELLSYLADPALQKLGRTAKLAYLQKLELPWLYFSEQRNSVQKATVQNLADVPIIEQALTPLTDIVHNRSSVEIMRGCRRGCRFCQAGYLMRPVRFKAKDRIRQEIEASLLRSGQEELSLLSLSSGDYPGIEELLRELNAQYAARKINFSLPSLRVDSLSIELLNEMQLVRKSTVTIAPEAGSERLRQIINKNLTEPDILRAAELAAKSGARSLKLYFMLGLPREEDSDLVAIVELAEKIFHNFPKNQRPNLTVNVSNFVPKPHTPFQWVPMVSMPEIERKQQLILGARNIRRINYRFHEPQMSILEGVMARGDRRTGAIILAAYRLGCRFDGWVEHFDFARWQTAIQSCGYKLAALLQGFPLEAELPWSKIKIDVPRELLAKEYAQAMGFIA